MLLDECESVSFIGWDFENDDFIFGSDDDLHCWRNTDWIDLELLLDGWLDVVFVFPWLLNFSIFNGKTINWSLFATNNQGTVVLREGEGGGIDDIVFIDEVDGFLGIEPDTFVDVELSEGVFGEDD